MPAVIQTATTGNLANAMRVAIRQSRYTEEHNAPMPALVEKFTLKQGEKSITVPKVGQMTAQALVDGQDLVDAEDIGMTSIDLTTGEVGLKVILTDKLTRQSNDDVMKMTGRQMGEAMARKKNRDLIALFAALNGGTTRGVAATPLTASLMHNNISFMRGKTPPVSGKLNCLLHPHTLAALSKSLVTIGSNSSFASALTDGYSVERLKSFYKGITIDNTAFFESGDIDIDASGDAIGALFAMDAMCLVSSQAYRAEKERDISLRAWEVVVTEDYGVFELDDTRGVSLTYDADTPGST